MNNITGGNMDFDDFDTQIQVEEPLKLEEKKEPNPLVTLEVF